MISSETSSKSTNRKYDYTLLVALCLLLVTGLVILYSTCAYNGEVKFHDSFYYLKKQLFASGLGIAGMFLIANIDYHFWQRLAVLGYITAILLSVAVIFVGDEYNGSKRWLSLGPFSFQPSEFAKVALILFLAWLVERNVKTIGSMRTLLAIVVTILPIVALVGASYLSTAIIILGIAVILIFVASPKYAQFFGMAFLGAGFMTIFLALESYRLERLKIWRHPENYEKGYQTLQGLYAIGSGGLFGMDSDHEKAPDQNQKKKKHEPGAEQPQLFTDDREDHIVLRFRHKPEFLHTFSQSSSKETAGTDGAYDDSGHFKYCSGNEYDTKYRNYASVYQLRRNIRGVSPCGNGACAECVKSGKIGEKDKKNPYREEDTWQKTERKNHIESMRFLCLHLEL